MLEVIQARSRPIDGSNSKETLGVRILQKWEVIALSFSLIQLSLFCIIKSVRTKPSSLSMTLQSRQLADTANITICPKYMSDHEYFVCLIELKSTPYQCEFSRTKEILTRE